MNKKIKAVRELLMSLNHEDIELGLIIAKNNKLLTAKQIDYIVHKRYNKGKSTQEQWSTEINRIFRRYLHCKPQSAHFTKWREDE